MFESKNLVLYLLYGLKFLFTFDNKVYDLEHVDGFLSIFALWHSQKNLTFGSFGNGN